MQTWLNQIVTEISHFNIHIYVLSIIILLGIVMLILNMKGH